MSPATAALWIVAGMAVFGVSDNLVPLLADELSVWQVMMLRSLLALPIAVVWAARQGMPGVLSLAGRRPWRVAVRSLLAASALFLYFSAMPAVGLGLAAAGMFTSPIFILLISAFLLRERIGPRRIAAVLLGTIGMVLVLGIGAVPVSPLAVLPLAAGFFYAVMVIWTREHCREESSLTLSAWLLLMFAVLGAAGAVSRPLIVSLFGGVEGADFLHHPWTDVAPLQWTILLAIGFSALVGSAFLATGYRNGPASVVGLFDYSFLVWGPFFAWLMRGEVVSLRALAGMALIAMAGLLAAWSARQRAPASRAAGY